MGQTLFRVITELGLRARKNKLGVVAWEEFFGTWNVDRLRICFREHHVRKKIAIYNIFCAITFASIAFWLIEAWRSLLKQSRSDRVYNLWGAYSKEYTCPFVSPENWLEVAVYAGEKNYPLKKHSNN